MPIAQQEGSSGEARKKSDLTSLSWHLSWHKITTFLREGEEKPLTCCFISWDNKVIYDELFAQHTPPWEDLSSHLWLLLFLHRLQFFWKFLLCSFLPPIPSHSLQQPVMGKGQRLLQKQPCVDWGAGTGWDRFLPASSFTLALNNPVLNNWFPCYF